MGLTVFNQMVLPMLVVVYAWWQEWFCEGFGYSAKLCCTFQANALQQCMSTGRGRVWVGLTRWVWGLLDATRSGYRLVNQWCIGIDRTMGKDLSILMLLGRWSTKFPVIGLLTMQREVPEVPWDWTLATNLSFMKAGHPKPWIPYGLNLRKQKLAEDGWNS